MKLDRLVLVNWGQLPPGDYEFGNMTLLTGATGAGKSTLLDGLQTVMTAAYQGIVAYNPGQEETHGGRRRGKTQRTLESFICGAEYSLFSRPDGAHGCVAAVFRPQEGETSAKAFTAVVAVSARVDGQGERRSARLERLELILVDDEALGVDDFLKDAQKSEWVAVDELVKRLKARYRKVTSFDSHKKDYLCALYGRFRGRTSVSWDETAHAAKAWSQSIAYKPIGSVHELVRDDILEFDGKQLQESISSISGLMRDVTNLREEGARLQETVSRLKLLKQSIDDTAVAFDEQVQCDLLLARLQLREDDAKASVERQNIDNEDALLARNGELLRGLSGQRGAVELERARHSAALQGIQAYGAKERLELQEAHAQTNARNLLEELSRGLKSAANLEAVGRRLMSVAIPKDFVRLAPAVQAVADVFARTELGQLGPLMIAVHRALQAASLEPDDLLELCGQFEGLGTGLANIYKSLVGPVDSVSVAIAADQAALESRIATEQATVRDLAAAKARLVGGASNYDAATAFAVARIKESLPEASVVVLCDLVEPVSTQWQPAIEGYLGGARFNLIVKPDFEARAIDFLQSLRSKSRVVQGRLSSMRADSGRVPADSIIHELRTQHAIAQAYLIEQYGSVVKVANSEELRKVPRGLTIDGKGSGSRTMFVVDNQDLVFGRTARANALARTTALLDAAELRCATLLALQATLGDARTQLATVSEPKFDPDPLLNHAGDIEQARAGLGQLDLQEVNQIELLLSEVNRRLEAIDGERDNANRANALAQERQRLSRAAINTLLDRRDSRLAELERQIQRLKHLCEVNPERTFTVLSEQVDQLMTGTTAAQATSRREQLRTRPMARLGEMRELLSDHNAKAKSDERFVSNVPYPQDGDGFDPVYGPLVALGRAVGDLHNEFEGVGLYNNRSEVEKAERSFHDVFTQQFCVEIQAKVEDGVRTLRHINDELGLLKFGTDRFRIDWSQWEPEFEGYYGFFKAVAELNNSQETVDLFGPAVALTDKHRDVRDRLVRLLLDKDQERAARDLLRIADYRNYRRYEIWNESDSGGRIALSTWGTGSGGQLETPAYIVRAAVVTNRMKLFDKGASLKLLVSDESFSRMDETRARAVLRYLRDNLGLQLVSAMPTRGAGGLRPEFEREFSFSRAGVESMNGELDFIIECDERHFKRDRLRDMWEEHRQKAREQAKQAFEAKEPAPASATPLHDLFAGETASVKPAALPDAEPSAAEAAP